MSGNQFVDFKKVDKHSGVPAYLQIINQIKAKVIIGQLKKGTQLPPVRELERIFDVNINTILKALERLKVEGLVEAEQGVGYFISGDIDIDRDVVNTVENLVQRLKSKNVDLYTTLALIEEVWNNG
ncbi:GntR family transcriptional regulator [Fervidobacterium sp. 2310opik-2]|uniref:GntR family transcriptional regulator n=1 Tax=Fervidobacterium sp. 2310opik-2 TaxID=1755815 RepID=UPI0013DEF7D4|nr:GntR family transcriptional regulator [Fervidobacterium sp. 2310opik-2]